MSSNLILVLAPTGRAASNINGPYFELTDEQRRVATDISDGFTGKSHQRHFVLHAEPGSGKSNVTKWLAANAFGPDRTCFAVCTTSMWLRAKVNQAVADLIASPGCATKIADPKQIKAIIFEEYSMLPGVHLTAIHERFGGGSRPFGGLPVLFTGDQFQLPCVSGDSCIATPLFRSLSITMHTLTEQLRLEGDNDLYTLLVKEIKRCIVDRQPLVRNADTLDYSISTSGGMRNVPDPTKAQILCCTGARSREWNMKALKKLAELHPDRERFVVVASKKDIVDPASSKLTFLVTGCRVSVKHNVYVGSDCVSHNGELGIFEGLEGAAECDDVITVEGVSYNRVRLAKKLVFKFKPLESDTVKLLSPVTKLFEGDVKKRLCVPIEPSHAMTVHKSQGVTLSGRVHFDTEALDSMLQENPGLLYVALTRVVSGRLFTANLTSFSLNATIRGLAPLGEHHRLGIQFARTGALE